MRNITCTDFHQLPFWKSWLEQVDSWHFNCWFEQVDLLDDTIKGEETLNIFKAVGTNQDMHVIFDIISSFVGIWWQRKKMEQLVRLYLMNSNDSSRWLLDSWYFDNLRYTYIFLNVDVSLMSRWLRGLRVPYLGRARPGHCARELCGRGGTWGSDRDSGQISMG